MNIYITLDYELFFGMAGTVEKSIIQPTSRLMLVLEKHYMKAVFFVDVGYLLRAKSLEKEYPELKVESAKVVEQIKELVAKGHDIQLHVHSHWEDAIFESGQWKFPLEHYRLHSYSDEGRFRIFKKYKEYLEKISGQKVSAFRAGGWCIQPFNELKESFIKTGIKFDSTVFAGGKNVQGKHYYDFSKAPDLTEWNFSKDPCVEEENGIFTEIPISSYRVSPFFFWKLVFYKKLGGTLHKQMGDGKAIENGLFQKLRLLFRSTNSVVSIDGYKASYLERAFAKNKKKPDVKNFVIIGHPKAFTEYSLDKLDKFLEKYDGQITTSIFRDR